MSIIRNVIILILKIMRFPWRILYNTVLTVGTMKKTTKIKWKFVFLFSAPGSDSRLLAHTQGRIG